MKRLIGFLAVLAMVALMGACTMSQTTNGASAQNAPVQPTNSNNPVTTEAPPAPVPGTPAGNL